MNEVPTNFSSTPLLDYINGPEDVRWLDDAALVSLADELRDEVIDVVSQTGGHLGSSLGVVELTIAIHAVFNTPHDKLIWDVGHQCYPHKILTGRRSKMLSLRQGGGLSGFTKRSEAIHDPFGAAHSSTSISAALGFATARGLGGDVGEAIAVIGDGALSAGLAYEALNNAGNQSERLFVILNDNEMSIAPPVGAVSQYLTGISGKMAAEPTELANHMPGEVRDSSRHARNLILNPPGGCGTMFEQLGFTYIGPIDGHDLPTLLPALRQAKTLADGPVLIHVRTIKGKGYAPAEEAADRGHGVGSFDKNTGKGKKKVANAPSYTSVFGKALSQEASIDERVVAITAAMPSGTGVDILAKAHPSRVFDVGIAEQHGVTFAAGLAAAGMKPFCAIYSTFLQRAYDQIVHDVALQNLPVRFAIDRAGLVGADGATHAGSFDVGYLSALPNMVVMAAADEAELMHMVRTAVAYDGGPISFRYPRGEGVGAMLPERGQVLELGKGRILQEGGDVALLSFGAHLEECRMAASQLEARGYGVTLADARFAKPLDTALIKQLVRHHKSLVLVEQGARGGFGAMVLHYLAEKGLLGWRCQVRSITLPDLFIDQASPLAMYEQAGMTSDDIVREALAGL